MAQELEVSAGAFWRSLPSTVTYEATIPLNYEAIWYGKEESEQMQFPKNCINHTEGKPECYILKQLQLLTQAYNLEVTSLENSWNIKYLQDFLTTPESHYRNKRSLDFLGEGLSWCCGVATQRKLDTFTAREDILRNQIFKLNKGLSKTLTQISENSKAFNNYEKTVSTAFNATENRIHLLESYTTNLKNQILKNENEQSNMVLSIMYNQFQNLKHVIQITRAIKKQSILNSCRQHQIPIAILNPTVLSEDLAKLENELKLSNQGLAIPIKEISKLYHLPVSECAFTKNKILVHIKIPITHKGQYWELFELVTTPFAWLNQTCIINHDTLYLAVAKNPNQLNNDLRQISGSGLHHCKPYHDKLCFLPRFSADTLKGPACAKKLYRGATVEDINHHCPMNCHKSTTTIISELDEEIYIITHPKPVTAINCPQNSKQLPPSAYSSPGALKIRLPCNCELTTNKEILIPKRFPCPEALPNEAIFTHMIPAAWSNLKSFVLNPKYQDNLPKFKNFTECLNKNWSVTVPHLNLTSNNDNIREIIDNMDNYGKLSYSDSFGTRSDTIFLIWNTIMSALLGYIIFNRRNLPLVTGVLGSASEEKNTPLEHNILFSSICSAALLFIVYITIRYFKQFCDSKRRNTSECTTNDASTVSTDTQRHMKNQYILEIDTNISTLTPGDSISCTLHNVQ